MPRGNLDLYKHGFKTERCESCTSLVSLRMPKSLKMKLKDIPNWQDKARDFLESLAEQEKVSAK